MTIRHILAAATLAATFVGAGTAFAAHSRYAAPSYDQDETGVPGPGYRGEFNVFGGGGPPTYQNPQEGYLPRLSAATGTLCVKQCPNDQLPCDPPYFKQADGRCSTQWR